MIFKTMWTCPIATKTLRSVDTCCDLHPSREILLDYPLSTSLCGSVRNQERGLLLIVASTRFLSGFWWNSRVPTSSVSTLDRVVYTFYHYFWITKHLLAVYHPLTDTHKTKRQVQDHDPLLDTINPYPTAFPYGNGMVLHFYQQQESSTTKTVHKVINKGLKAYV